MTANMSLWNAPDEALVGRVAGALAIDEAFVENDSYVRHAIEHLAAAATEDFQPVFSGGASLPSAVRNFSRLCLTEPRRRNFRGVFPVSR